MTVLDAIIAAGFKCQTEWNEYRIAHVDADTVTMIIGICYRNVQTRPDT
ncbi:hypothetical protein Mpal_1229 [Methanosphaerula palustris E1-9c]|uniref:Uncharacterized protein n=1 Tax=Methanosphaerula palustris (strain ATCC BAA-1556 / DSM 19958 / E1-9c) TaxID=521011 RepID=B8GHG2_METPE|nr:hypothetical protein Mpal_1229 [Methanosphaerula palustris E1-9c]